MTSQLWARARGCYIRTAARLLYRRPFPIKTHVPYISFTFDDFPRSAVYAGGAILQSFGLRGTFYASLGLMGKQAATGTMFLREDLERLVAAGHEVGCHTFGHYDAAETRADLFEKSIIQNREAAIDLIPGVSLETLSYPISPPNSMTKRRMAQYFVCCRGGGQAFNSGIADLNYLASYFLEQSRDNPEAVKRIIDQNRQDRGWLIFSTHDVCEVPTSWGCTPAFFEDVVTCSVASGARILPVAAVLGELSRTSF